jgi:hypothetical protein
MTTEVKGNIESAMKALMTNLGTFANELSTDITSATTTTTTETGTQEISQAALLDIQFKMGEYNSIMELSSTVSKGVTDMMKTLAQRSS